jgi:ABC-type multidrug transport system fused ATPase/permease subunit
MVREMVWDIQSLLIEGFKSYGELKDSLNTLLVPYEINDLPEASEETFKDVEVDFKNVGFHYPNGKMVFENLSFTLRPDERVGVVGRSGAGKSTLVNLLLRFYDIQNGEILFNGVRHNSMAQDSLREHISVVPQDPVLFHRSLKENISYGKPDATDEEIWDAIRKAQCEEFIKHLPEGLESIVGERGIKLSGGQRQRIAICRAMLKDSPLVILDEATSSLDSESEKAIQVALNELFKGRTVMVIAHRLSTIASLDRIIVFDHGKIVEDGSHEELIKKQGHYAHLWSLQSQGFLPD